MKIIHTADWHLGNTFHRHDRELEHRHFLSWLLTLLQTEEADALLVSGDVFDTSNPSAQAERLFYDFLQQAVTALPGLQVVVTAGNHDSAARLEAPRALLETQGITVRGLVRRGEDGQPDWEQFVVPLCERGGSEPVCMCVAIPFLRTVDLPAGQQLEEGLSHYFTQSLLHVRRGKHGSLPCIAMGHFYASGAQIAAEEHSERLVVGGQDVVDAKVVSHNFSYVALGHIHKAQQVGAQGQVYYAGSALPMSFSERNYVHGVQVIEIDKEGHLEVGRAEYEPLRSLLSVPSRGVASPDEVLGLLRNLPSANGDADNSAWPYLEIRIRSDRPTPELMADATQILSTKAVNFCRMVAQRPDEVGQPPETAFSLERLRSLTPLQMAEAIYEERYGSPLPAELRLRFEKAVEKAHEQ